MSTRRVLLVVANGGHGGMQVQVALLARGLAEQGVVVEVACGGPVDLDVGDVPVHELPALTPSTSRRFASALRGVVGTARPDVVHGHGLRLAPFLALAARRTSLVTCHGIDPARVRRTATMVRLSGVKVASCGEGPRALLGAQGVPSRVLDNAVPPLPPPLARDELARRFGLDPARLLVVSPARLTPQKDPLTLVRALAYAPADAVLVGGGPLAGEVRDEIAREGLGTHVVVAEWLDDARAVLGGADVLALSSRWEGQPTVVLEAMAAGVAVVATDSTGLRDTIVDGRTGLLATAGDAVALGAALTSAADPAVRRALTTEARASVASHAPEIVVAAHLSAYERVQSGAWP